MTACNESTSGSIPSRHVNRLSVCVGGGRLPIGPLGRSVTGSADGGGEVSTRLSTEAAIQ